MEEVKPSLVPDNRLLPGVKQVDNWICWDRHHDPEKNKPVPLNTDIYYDEPDEFEASDPFDPDIRLSYTEARRKWREHDSISGIGFVMRDTPFCYVDLDDCVEGLTVDPEARELLEGLYSYTELSPSGTGLHVVCRGPTPREGWSHPLRDLNVEVYGKSWATISEEHLAPFPTEARPAEFELKRICKEYRIDIYGEG